MSVVLLRRVGTAAFCLATAAAMTTISTSPAGANPAGTGVVISEVYGGAGNSGAALTNDFIELYNPTGSEVSLVGWSVQYAPPPAPPGRPPPWMGPFLLAATTWFKRRRATEAASHCRPRMRPEAST